MSHERYRTAFLEGHCPTTNSQLENVIGYYPTLALAVEAALEGTHSIIRDGHTGLIVWDSFGAAVPRGRCPEGEPHSRVEAGPCIKCGEPGEAL